MDLVRQKQYHRGFLLHYLLVFLMRDLWMCGRTPPPAMVPMISVLGSSSPWIVICRWCGLISFTLRSFLALPARSRTSVLRYLRMTAD